VPGAGLGLTVVKAIVEGHGGEIGVLSAPGAGTTMRVALPLA
jgi:two-component system, OmpR family, phosphate regulon sensor histidine kinase PhoR